jgi:hypothetical protein
MNLHATCWAITVILGHHSYYEMQSVRQTNSVKRLDDSNMLGRMSKCRGRAWYKVLFRIYVGAEKNYEKSRVGRYPGLDSNRASPVDKWKRTVQPICSVCDQ